ncbi:kojibiose phosphorylase [Propionicimonas paludicola]|uniref:Kojibiose phosphorylase n=1 Tax=Propionicimonas paludicola TaxID=185243 RepID=A0A2A9CV98_9ACTN|nr:glycoside hydrolase family 65 protein [Propionicimonas paludicola]PFG18344.1 kojibiose phosphorylase [Propionicimonas paludicola]
MDATDQPAPGWTLDEAEFHASGQHHGETIFTIGNGQQCLRGGFEEGYPGERTAGFAHRLWDAVPVFGEELAALPRWWGVQLWAGEQPIRLDTGRIEDYRRSLDLRTGVLSRSYRWQGPDGAAAELSWQRFIDFSRPQLAVIRLTVRALTPLPLRAWAGLSAAVENSGLVHWAPVGQQVSGNRAELAVRTRTSGITLGCVAELSCRVPSGEVEGVGLEQTGEPTLEYRAELARGEELQLTKYVALVPEFEAEQPLVAARELAAQAVHFGWVGLRSSSDAAWAQVWEACDIEIDGDPEAQLAIRFALFQLNIAVPRFTDRASLGAKTLSGLGYRHHVFWDTEIFMLPVFSFTQPELAANLLRYRWHGLDGARRKAAEAGRRGAQFPWESAATGEEVTPRWIPDPDHPGRQVPVLSGDRELHVTADVGYAAWQYWQVTNDQQFLLDYGAELILDGAQFWASAAVAEPDGHYHLRQVIGPDEYHEVVDDNAFTNQLAAWHLHAAGALAAWLAEHQPQHWARLCAELGLDAAELAHWLEVAAGLYVPFEPESGLIEQFAGYFDLDELPEALLQPNRTVSWQRLLGFEEVQRTRAIKQPDVLMLAHLLPELFTAEQLRANQAFYDLRTDHEYGSSLGPAISSVVAARAGEIELAYVHFLRAARTDLADARGNADDGIHGAAAGGLWQAVVFGFAGFELTADGWRTRPRLPHTWRRLAINLTVRGRRERIEIPRP